VLLLLVSGLLVEMVLATQCIMQSNQRINVNGKLSKGVGPKDVALYIISQLTTSGGTGYFVEYAGDVFEHVYGRSHDGLQQLSKWGSWRYDCSRPKLLIS
jgi:hypothetical protein